MDIQTLRAQLTETDAALLDLVAKRQALVTQIGENKLAEGRPTRDYAREKVVLQGARARAATLGLDPDMAEDLLRHLIRASLTRQEALRVAREGQGTGRRALILGGRGKMGGWFANFLASQGFEIDVADPAGPLDGAGYIDDWTSAQLDHDLVVVAAPLGVTSAILEQLATLRPSGLIVDIGSLKTPLRAGLRACIDAGLQVASIHPMFGPDARLLSDKHVIFVELGLPQAQALARELFAPTMAEQVEMGLDEHDQMMAYVLGLSHALNIAFFTALTESAQTAQTLARLSSTTFDAQLAVAARVARESPALYFEIQAANEHGAKSLDALERAIHSLRRSVDSADIDSFTALMDSGRRYFAD